MIVYTVQPVVADAHHPDPTSKTGARSASSFVPAGDPPSLYRAIHRAGLTRPELPEDGTRTLDLGAGLQAVVQRSEDHRQHPLDALVSALGLLRDGQPAPQVCGASRLLVPGQGGATSLITTDGIATGVHEGVVLVLCEGDDWQRPREVDLRSSYDVLPALLELVSGRPADYDRAGQGSYRTSDGRGIVIDAPGLYEVHDDVETAEDETWPTLLHLAGEHARRSYDIAVAARLMDILVGAAGRDDDADHDRLAELRRVQVRLAGRHAVALLRHPTYVATAGDDAFRIRHLLDRVNAQADQDVSAAFQAFQPLVEAAEAAAAQQRRSRDDHAARQLAVATEEHQSRVRQVVQLASAAFAGVSLVGLFAALAAVPEQDALLPTRHAAFATIALVGAIAGVAGLLQLAMGGRLRTARALGRAAAPVGTVLVLGGLVGASLSWAGLLSRSVPALLGVLALLLVGGVVLVEHVTRRASGSGQPVPSPSSG